MRLTATPTGRLSLSVSGSLTVTLLLDSTDTKTFIFVISYKNLMKLRIRDNVVHKHHFVDFFAGDGDQKEGECDVLPPATLVIHMETACTQPCNAGADWLLSDQHRSTKRTRSVIGLSVVNLNI